jgi:recombination protein RecA
MPEYTPGGRAKGFASSVEIRLRQGDLIKEKDTVVGQIVKYKIAKNKVYMRLKTGEFDMYLDENDKGIKPFFTDVERSIVVEAVAWELIERGGAWYYLDREKDLKFNGVDKLVEYLKENPNLIEVLKIKILDLAKKKG